MAEKVAEKKSLFVNGGNGGPVVSGTPADELDRARDIARRYRCEFVDLNNFQLHHDLFKKIPVDLMFRYNFVPLEETSDGKLAIAIADPSQLMMIDEISLLLGKRIVTKVSTLTQISEILKKTEQSQRVLEEASEGFALDVIHDDESVADETISIDKLTAATGDISPIIRLVDTTIFTALQRRASDIHVETHDDSVGIKFRIDGVLTQAMPPIGREHHSTIISRIKVMSELDISERRVPQDGRFRVKYNGRAIDFRVSIMPSIQSALTGHLVFTTVHANNVVDVIGRFLNMGVEPYNFVSALNCILAQRLVRVICDCCRTTVHYSPEELEASGLDPAQWLQVPFYEGQGCIECAGTGFRGRTAIHELLDLSDRIREMILAKKPTSEIRRAAREEGMRFLRESALDKVRLGLTTLKEINKVTFIESMR